MSYTITCVRTEPEIRKNPLSQAKKKPNSRMPVISETNKSDKPFTHLCDVYIPTTSTILSLLVFIAKMHLNGMLTLCFCSQIVTCAFCIGLYFGENK